MLNQPNFSNGGNEYFINREEAEETARLLFQDRSLTREMGGNARLLDIK